MSKSVSTSRLRPRQRLGQAGEQMARHALEARGLEIVASNYRRPFGELDLIARSGDVWVFVEVKTRRGNRFGSAADAVDARKQRKVIEAAETYLQENSLFDAAWRIDVVAIDMDSSGRLLGINIIENAVSR